MRIGFSGDTRMLMSGMVDYAGLFPPAGLDMASAVRNYDSYRRGPHAWMLGRFIVPVARLDEFAREFDALGSAATAPWKLSVIAKGSDGPALDAFNARTGGRAVIDTVEAPVVSEPDLPALGDLARRFTVYAEVSLNGNPAGLIAKLKEHGLRAKVRTGGVTPEAIPAATSVALFIVACHKSGVPFKATAGLHHAIRGEYPLTYEPASPRAEMFGFLNVLMATTPAAAGEDTKVVAQVLAATDFHRDPPGESPKAGATLSERGAERGGIISFGSCSFEEPVAELAALGMI